MPSLYTFQNLNLRLDVIHKDDCSENANIFSEYPQKIFFYSRVLIQVREINILI